MTSKRRAEKGRRNKRSGKSTPQESVLKLSVEEKAKICQVVEQKEPISYTSSILEAQRLYEAGKTVESLRLCLSLLKEFGANPLILEIAGNAAYINDQAAVAISLLEKALEIDPGHMPSLKLLFKIAKDVGDTVRAKKIEQKIFQLGACGQHSDIEDKNSASVTDSNSQGSPKGMLSGSERLIYQLHKVQKNIIEDVGLSSDGVGAQDIGAGVEASKKNVALSSRQNKDEYFKDILEMYSVGNLVRALIGCASILEKDPWHADSWHLVGVISAQAGDVEAAEIFVRKAIKISSEVADYYNSLGVILYQRNSLKEAVKAFKSALQLEPQHKDAIMNLDAINVSLARAKGSGTGSVAGSLIHVPQSSADAVSSLCSGMHMTKEFTWLLSHLGDTLDINEVRFRSYNIWPLIRVYLYLNRANMLFGGSGLYALQEIAGKEIVNPLVAAKKNLSGVEPIGQSGRANFLFMTTAGEHQKISEGGPRIHRHLDPLIEAMADMYESKKFQLGELPPSWRYHIPPEKLSLQSTGRSTVSRLSLPDSFISELNLILKRFGCQQAVNKDQLEAWLLNIFRGSDLFSASLPLESTRAVFVRCYYTPAWLSLAIAAKEAGAAIIDVQHARVGPYHGCYTHWTGTINGERDLLPDTFWLWGSPWDACINTGDFADQKNRIVCAGDPWESYSSDFLNKEEVEALNKLTSCYKRVAMVSLTWSRPLPSLFKQAVLKTSGQVLWLVRAHPLDRSSLRELEDWVASEEIKNVELKLASRLPLTKVLSYADSHVTTCSSVAFDAAMLGIRTLFLHEAGFDVMADLISCDMAIFCQSAEELADQVSAGKTQSKSPIWKPLSIDRQGVVKVMKQVFSELK